MNSDGIRSTMEDVGRCLAPSFGCVASLNVGVGRCLVYIRKRSQITESEI